MILHFWQNMLSMHQAALLQSLSDRGHEIRWSVDQELFASRHQQGWHVPVMRNIDISLVCASDVGARLERSEAEVLHIFSPRGSATGPELLRNFAGGRYRSAILAEKPSGMAFPLRLRSILYRYLARRSRNCQFVLGMGELAADWYARHGFPRVHSFAYAVEASNLVVRTRRPGPHRFVCIAQLIPRKAIDLLLRALAPSPAGWQLTIVGLGPLSDKLKSQAKALRLDSRINWVPAVDNAAARRLIAEADTLLLPSHWEGWGVPVNEAIAEGTRVIVSNQAGASCLLSLGDVGQAFPAGEADKLRAALEGDLMRGPVDIGERSLRRTLHGRINGTAMASYFESIAEGRPLPPPWRDLQSPATGSGLEGSATVL